MLSGKVNFVWARVGASARFIFGGPMYGNLTPYSSGNTGEPVDFRVIVDVRHSGPSLTCNKSPPEPLLSLWWLGEHL